MCFGAIINSRIKNLYFGVEDNENGFRALVENNSLFFVASMIIEIIALYPHNRTCAFTRSIKL